MPAILRNNHRLLPGESLSTATGYTLCAQNDANLVLYGPNGAMTATNTVNRYQPVCLNMQTDNNLVFYGVDGAVIWASGTDRRGSGAADLVLDDNGVARIIDATGCVLWTFYDAHTRCRWSYGCWHLDTFGPLPLARGSGVNHTNLICEQSDGRILTIDMGGSQSSIDIQPRAYNNPPLGKHDICANSDVSHAAMLNYIREGFQGKNYRLGTRDCWKMVQVACGRLGVDHSRVGGPLNQTSAGSLARDAVRETEHAVTNIRRETEHVATTISDEAGRAVNNLRRAIRI